MLVIEIRRANPTLEFAAAELHRYLPACSGTLRLQSADTPDFEQDAYEISLDATGGGEIRGSNPRSVLFGVYRLLQEMGFAFIRPGKYGTVMPPPPGRLPELHLADRGGYRHRGICIEGAVSRENVLDTIDWMTKLGFNAYFIQFRSANTFFDRWYRHLDNPLLAPEPFDNARAEAITAELRGAVHRRGLDLQMVGHGWTCEPFGIPGPGWVQHTAPIAAAVRAQLAEVGGKRELWGGIALNTNLCYGQEKVRATIAEAIAEYAVANPDVGIIHFWLADGSNNQCECPLCRDRRPADWYIDMLNLVDEKLTAVQSPAKIVFLVYVDLLWPPEKTRFIHPERFILMFAPITRSYTRPFAPQGKLDAGKPELPPYRRNQLEFPQDPEANLRFLRAWQQIFHGSSFDFDYHFMWDHHKDAGYYTMAEVLHADCRNLHALGLDGYVSCQNQRTFYPNALGMHVLGKTLWNPQLSFEAIATEFFHSAYGVGAEAARSYFKAISAACSPKLLRREGNAAEVAAGIAALDGAATAIAAIQSPLQRGLTDPDPCRRESWAQLELHTQQTQLLMPLLRAAWSNTDPSAAAHALFTWAQQHEMRLQSDFDVYEYIETLIGALALDRNKLNLGKQ